MTKTAFIPTNKILKYIIIATQVKQKTEEELEVSKAPIEIIHNNTLRTKHIKQPQIIIVTMIITLMMNVLY